MSAPAQRSTARIRRPVDEHAPGGVFSYSLDVRFLRWTFWLAAIAVMIWFAATVPLGNRTLIGHIRAIAATPEARDLARGTGEEVRKVKERIEKELRPDGGAPAGSDTRPGSGPSAAPTAPPQPPIDQLTDDDRRALQRLVRERAAARAPNAP